MSSSEVEDRRLRYGANSLQEIHHRPAWKILIDQFGSIIIALLAFAAIVAWLTSDYLEAAAILVVLLLNALIGFTTEWQAGRALDALRKQTQVAARVRRDGEERSIDAIDLVTGDIIVLNAGDRVPADARIVRASGLRAEESALTGESVPVDKLQAPALSDAPIAERHSMLFMGTTIAAGRAVAVVTSTGVRTELGKIGKLVAEESSEKAPLERRLGELGRRLVYVVLGIALVVLIEGWLSGKPAWVMLEVSISLAVAAVPEGLPAVTTLILAFGVLRMARANALVRRLPAVETLGSTTVICTDKTGTLTENRMTVRRFELADGVAIDVSGRGEPARGSALLARTARVGILCNEASFHSGADQKAEYVGDPTETALLAAADTLGLDVITVRSSYRKLAEYPFDPVTKRMIVVHVGEDGERIFSMKGAPAVILDACALYAQNSTSEPPLNEPIKKHFLAENEKMADQAMRVLALAEKRKGPGSLADPEVESGYTFLGFVGMIDPPRAEVADAIQRAHHAGIRTVMLTGDQINTARAIARALRLGEETEPRALHARDLEGADRSQVAVLAGKTDVFARVSPQDKLLIVEALQQAGEVVAVTGDGVNDAPALKRADIGIAMGRSGTEAAKEAADVVLADDNFSTIVSAIEGGRTIYSNIVKFVHMMFSHNLGEVMTIFFAILIGLPLPLMPLQILWMNLVTDVFPAMALALEPTTPGVMQRPPRSPRAALLSPRLLLLIGWQGAMLAAISLTLYLWALRSYGEGAHSRTMALFALIAVQLGHMFNCRSRTHSALDGLFRNPLIWLAAFVVICLQLLAVYFAPLARVLGTVRLNSQDWLLVAMAVILPIAIVEVTKAYARWTRREAIDGERRFGLES
jgi:Ca2+-transporting ATPase